VLLWWIIHSWTNILQAHVLEFLFNVFVYVIRSNSMYFAAACHQCTFPNKESLDTSKSWPPKTTAKVKERVMGEAAGGSTDDAVPVVEMGSDGKSSQRWRVVGMGKRALLPLLPITMYYFPGQLADGHSISA
jgi:hypothetical protein